MREEGGEDSLSVNVSWLLTLGTSPVAVYLGLGQALRRALALSRGTRFEQVETASREAKGIGI